MTAFRSCVRELTEKKRIISARMTKPMTDFSCKLTAEMHSHLLTPSWFLLASYHVPGFLRNNFPKKSIDHVVEKEYNSSRVQEVMR